jgi:hypothetical protein
MLVFVPLFPGTGSRLDTRFSIGAGKQRLSVAVLAASRGTPDPKDAYFAGVFVHQR